MNEIVWVIEYQLRRGLASSYFFDTYEDAENAIKQFVNGSTNKDDYNIRGVKSTNRKEVVQCPVLG